MMYIIRYTKLNPVKQYVGGGRTDYEAVIPYTYPITETKEIRTWYQFKFMGGMFFLRTGDGRSGIWKYLN